MLDVAISQCIDLIEVSISDDASLDQVVANHLDLSGQNTKRKRVALNLVHL